MYSDSSQYELPPESKETRMPKVVDHDAQRVKFAEAAMSLIAQHGLEGVTMRAVAARWRLGGGKRRARLAASCAPWSADRDLADGGHGRVHGVVRDADDAPLPGVRLTLDGFETRTDREGRFVAPRIASGRTQLVARLPRTVRVPGRRSGAGTRVDRPIRDDTGRRRERPTDHAAG